MYVIDNGKNENRLGISISKKVGNSVVRHHLTRLIKESYRLNEEKFLCGKDIVVVVQDFPFLYTLLKSLFFFNDSENFIVLSKHTY